MRTLLGLLLLVAVATPALAKDDRAARSHAHFEAGQGYFHLGDYRAAIHQFTAGYALMRNPIFLLNIGQSYRQLGQPKDAVGMFERFVAEIPPGDPRRAEVRALIDEVRRSVLPANLDPPVPAARPSLVVPIVAQPVVPVEHRRTWLWVTLGLVAAALVAATAITLAVELGGSSAPPTDLGTIHPVFP